MDERWAKIERIFNRVLEAEESRRSALLEESCAGDEFVRREVESLLTHHKNAGDFIETPAFEDTSAQAAENRCPPSKPPPKGS